MTGADKRGEISINLIGRDETGTVKSDDGWLAKSSRLVRQVMSS